jgi:serine/threonine protein kinase
MLTDVKKVRYLGCGNFGMSRDQIKVTLCIGEVYLGSQNGLTKIVLKTLVNNNMSGFYRESELLQSLRSSYIVQFLGLCKLGKIKRNLFSCLFSR